MGIYELISSIFGGGIVGLIGSLAQKYFAYQTAKLELQKQKNNHEHEREMMSQERMFMEAEAKARIQIIEEETRGAIQAAKYELAGEELDAQKASYAHDSATYSKDTDSTLMRIVDFFRGLIRPLLTLYLCAVSTYITYKSYVMYNQTMTLIKDNLSRFTGDGALVMAKANFELLEMIITALLFLASTAVTWWFGSRDKFIAFKK